MRVVRGQPGDRPQALRVLEANGLVEMGRRPWGAFVTAPSSRLVGEGIADLIRWPALTAGEVTEASGRSSSSASSGWSDERPRTRTSPRSTRSATGAARARGRRLTLELSAEWHSRYAQSAHNRAVAMLVASLHGPLLMSLEKAREAAPARAARRREHRSLVDAIAARDADRAKQLMSEHLHRTAERIAALEVPPGGKPATPARSA